jgi:hypothetical protein
VIELLNFERNIRGATAETRQSPVVRKTKLFFSLPVNFSSSNFTIQKPDPALSTGTFPTAWKFNPEFVQHVNQRSLIVYLDFFSERVKPDGVFFHFKISVVNQRVISRNKAISRSTD